MSTKSKTRKTTASTPVVHPTLEPRGLPIPAPLLPPKALCISDAAVYTATTPEFIERMIRCGRLPALRMCRQYSIMVSDLDAFLDSQPKVDPSAFSAPPDDRRHWRKGVANGRQRKEAA